MRPSFVASSRRTASTPDLPTRTLASSASSTSIPPSASTRLVRRASRTTSTAAQSSSSQSPDEKRRKDGSLAIADSLADFQKNWSIFSEGSLSQLVDWNNVVVAGGSVLGCLLAMADAHKESKRSIANTSTRQPFRPLTWISSCGASTQSKLKQRSLRSMRPSVIQSPGMSPAFGRNTPFPFTVSDLLLLS